MTLTSLSKYLAITAPLATGTDIQIIGITNGNTNGLIKPTTPPNNTPIVTPQKQDIVVCVAHILYESCLCKQ